jgi:glycosyltransferase involved in cell wall biosynthesis
MQLARILESEFGGNTVILEPHTPGSPIIEDFNFNSDIKIMRVQTAKNPHGSLNGHIDYLNKVNTILRGITVDELYLCSPYLIPILNILSEKITDITYYMLETPDMYSRWIKESHFLISKKVKKIIYVEKNRYIRDAQEFDFHMTPSVLYYNSYPVNREPIDFRRRNNRIINYGTLDNKNTYLDWYGDPPIDCYPIDLMGQVNREFQASGKVRLIDKVPHSSVAGIVSKYSFVITIWNENERRSRFAPSNKLFEAISLGVPIISAPHPQHVEVIQELECGIIMKDWTKGALQLALDQALSLMGTKKYEKLVRNCARLEDSRFGVPTNTQNLLNFIRENSSLQDI